MINRRLLFVLFLLVSLPGLAQENSLSKADVANTVAEQSHAEKVTLLTPKEHVEVGRHVLSNIDAGSMILSLLAVLVAIVVAAWLLKKLQVGGTTVNGLNVVSSLNLGTKERLVVVQVGKKQLF